MAVTDCKQDQWLLDYAADMHICNQPDYFLHYVDNPTAITGATLLAISPGQGTIKLDLLLKDGSRGATLTLYDV